MNPNQIYIACILLISFVPALIAADQSIDSLDTPFLSELRFKLRHEDKLVQCAKYWRGMDEKLKNTNPILSESYYKGKDLIDYVNVDLLMRVSSELKNRAGGGGRSLAEYLDNCVKIVVHYRAKDIISQFGITNASADPDELSHDNSLLESGKNIEQGYLTDKDELQKTIEQLKANNDELRNLVASNNIDKAELDKVNQDRVDLEQKLTNLNAELEHYKIELSKKDDLLKEAITNQADCTNNQAPLNVAASERSNADLESQNLIASLRKELTDKDKLFRSEMRRALFVSDNRLLELTDMKKEVDALTGKLNQCMRDLKAHS